MKPVAVVVPIRNEEKNIESCIKSILAQNFPREQMQVVFVDGLSVDATKEIVQRYMKGYPELFVLLDNPVKVAPVAMNIGIAATESDYIIRLDAHSEYPDDYITKCVDTLQTTDADNVGGLALSKGNGVKGEAYAQVLSSKFGVGNSGFRTGAKSGYVDTVPFGAFKRETFDKYGMYDERLVRNQDYEMNYRIRKNGGKIYLNSDIRLFYLCKNTILGIVKQSFDNGKWNVITMKMCPGSMGIRHFVPLAFDTSILFLMLSSLFIPQLIYLLGAELALYFILDLIFSLKNDEKRYKNRFFHKLLMFPTFHCSYGIGSICGLFSLGKLK